MTGTDTEVGKSVVTAVLAASAPGAAACKPLATGVSPGSFGDDAELLARASGSEPELYRHWPLPVSPHRAALERGDPAELEDVLEWIRERTRATTYVEGVGGWRVPITLSWGIPDLALGLGWPVLVVAANRLGVLNHTLLTVDAIRETGLNVCGVVLNEAAPAAPGETDARVRNLQDLKLLLDVPVVPMPALENLELAQLQQAGKALRSGFDTDPAELGTSTAEPLQSPRESGAESIR